jgi:hypothetical protein
MRFVCPTGHARRPGQKIWLNEQARSRDHESSDEGDQTRSLKSTSSRSCDFIHSHGLFVYLPFLVSYCYFKEIARVAAPGCVVTFNVFSEECLDAETAEKWLASGYEHACLLSSAYVKNFFEANGFRFVSSFILPYGPGKSEYLVFRRE